MYSHHGLEHQFPGGIEPRMNFMVCAIPRSGSSLLCDALAQTELAGAPTEYFDEESFALYSAKWAARGLEEYLAQLRARKTSPNGVFGFKAHYPQFEAHFRERDVLQEFPGLRCVYVTRADRVRQAISLYRAQSTGQWAAHQKTLRPAPSFDASAIRSCLATIAEQDASWERFFAERGVEPMRVRYEDLVRDYQGSVRAVLAFLGVEVGADFLAPAPTLERQAYRGSERWVRRYELVERYGPDLSTAPRGVRLGQECGLWLERASQRVSNLLSRRTDELDGFIDSLREEREALFVSGWVLLAKRHADKVEFVAPDGHTLLADVALRADVAQAHPDAQGAERAGFRARLPADAFAIDGGWRFTLRVRQGTSVAAHCEVRVRTQARGPVRANASGWIGSHELRLRCDAADPNVEPTPPEDALLGISIDTTSVCNLRCTMCALENSYPEKGVMSLETFRRLEDAFPSLRHLSLSLNAEPLLNKHLVEMVEFAKRASHGRVAISFATNGVLLDERRASALIEAGLDALEISLDGTTPRVFESIRIGAHFEPIVANIARIAELKRRLGRTTPHVSIRYTLSRDNLVDLPGLLDLALRVEVDHLVVNGLEPYDTELAQKVLYGPQAQPEVERIFESLEERCRAHGVRIDLPRLAPEEVDDCHLIDHACVMLWDGTVAPCSPLSYPRTFYFHGEPKQHPRVAFGNIHERSLSEIWNAPEYLDFRRKLRAGEVFDHCRTCLKRAGVICPLKHWKWLAAAPSAS